MTIGQPVLNLLVFVRSLSCARAKEKGLVLNAHSTAHRVRWCGTKRKEVKCYINHKKDQNSAEKYERAWRKRKVER